MRNKYAKVSLKQKLPMGAYLTYAVYFNVCQSNYHRFSAHNVYFLRFVLTAMEFNADCFPYCAYRVLG
jgi:hypothetical protein